jgi:isoleucyl-tRNA synthetase
VRRSRRRFWDGPRTPDGAAAFATLYECVRTLTQLMAPIVPFISDYVWGVLRTAEDPDSVHLTSWPAADQDLVDGQLSRQMRLVRGLVELGRSARAAASVQIRQPLSRALVGAPGFADLPPALRDQIATELNVHSLEAMSTVGEDLVDHVVKPNFRALGRRFGKGTQAVAAAITAADAASLAADLRTAGETGVVVDGERVPLGADDVIVTQTPRAGWTVATDAGETVALETQITGELRREGLAREVIRLIQDARKADGLDVSDRISLWWQTASPELAATLAEHGQLIAGEVLATEFRNGSPGADADQGLAEHTDGDLGLTFWLQRA